MVTVAEKSVWPCWMVSVPTTVSPSGLVDDVGEALAVLRGVVDDETFLRLERVLDVGAAAGPWVASLPRIRWKVSQPLSASVGLVADGVMVGRPASAKIGPAASDSPEKAGPTMPMTGSSPIAWVARPGGLVGVARGVVLLQVDLAVGVVVVVLVDGELRRRCGC